MIQMMFGREPFDSSFADDGATRAMQLRAHASEALAKPAIKRASRNRAEIRFITRMDIEFRLFVGLGVEDLAVNNALPLV